MSAETTGSILMLAITITCFATIYQMTTAELIKNAPENIKYTKIIANQKDNNVTILHAGGETLQSYKITNNNKTIYEGKNLQIGVYIIINLTESVNRIIIKSHNQVIFWGKFYSK